MSKGANRHCIIRKINNFLISDACTESGEERGSFFPGMAAMMPDAAKLSAW